MPTEEIEDEEAGYESFSSFDSNQEEGSQRRVDADGFVIHPHHL